MSHQNPRRTCCTLGVGYMPCIRAAMFIMAIVIGFASQIARAADAPTGTIEGRVLNLSNGQYLGNALVQVEGTTIQELTNEYGEFTLRNVPAGSVKVTVAYTGQEPKTTEIKVEAGKTAVQDFGLNKSKGVSDDGTIILDQYVVSQQRYKNAQEIATNEERRSVNVKDVVAADSLGYIPSGNVGEFVKYLPGVQTEYGGADSFSGAGIGGVNPSAASQVSIRGFGSDATSIRIDGVPVSGVGPASLTRAIGLDMLSVNNASRIEVIKVPTPDMDSDAAGGTINLVTKSAFEYAHPTYMAELSAIYNTSDSKIFGREPGPANKPTYHTLPNGSVSVAVPLSKNLGFTVSSAIANSYSPNYKTQASWQATYSTQYGSTTGTVGSGKYPLKTPYDLTNWTTTTQSSDLTRTTTYYNVGNIDNGKLSDITNPFLKQATDEQNPWSERRISASVKVDWKPFDGMLMTGSYTGSTYQGINVDRRVQLSVKGPMEWGPDYEIGRPYESGRNDTGNQLDEQVTALDKSGRTDTGYVRLKYVKGPWAIDGSASLSETIMNLNDFDDGHMYSVALTAGVGQINMWGITNGAPRSVEVYDKTGVAFDWQQPDQWTYNSVDVGSAKSKESNKENDYTLNVRRELDFLPFDLAVKVGGHENINVDKKAGLGTGYKMRYTGDTSAAFIDSITDTNFVRTGGLGFAKNQQWVDTYKMYNIYVNNPSLFNPDYDVTYSTSNYRSITNQQKSVRELKESYYAQLESSFFNHRLQVVGGFRQSRRDIDGNMPFTKSNWNMIMNPDGTIYRDSFYQTGIRLDGAANTRTNADGTTTVMNTLTTAGAVVTSSTVVNTINPTSNFYQDSALLQRLSTAGISIPSQLLLSQLSGTTSWTGTTSNNMDAARRSTYPGVIHGAQTNPITPSIVGSYNITDQLVFKTSWTRETQLPPLDAGNGLTGGILGTFTIAENNPHQATDGGDGKISISNPNLQPKIVDSWNFQVAYYFKDGGKIGANYYYKTIKNEWLVDTITPNSGAAYNAELALLGLNPDNFQNWQIVTTDNGGGTSHSSGYELEARDNLKFLGEWGSHFNLFGNYSHKDVNQSSKTGVVAMTAFSSNTWSGGLNVSAYRCSFTAKMVYQNELWEKNGTISLPKSLGTNADGTVIGDQLYKVTPQLYNLKLDFEYQVLKNVTMFISGDNVLNSKRTTNQTDAMRLLPAYAKVTQSQEFGVAVAAGIRAQF